MAGTALFSHNSELAKELLTVARLLDTEVKVLSINDEPQAELMAGLGANVFQISNEVSKWDTGATAATIVSAARVLGVNTIILSSDRRGKELAGRVAQKFGAGCLTDIKAVHVTSVNFECERNAFGGATLANQVITSENKVMAISPRSFKPAEANGKIGTINNVSVPGTVNRVSLVKSMAKKRDSVNIPTAEIIIAVGCGVEEASYLPKIESIADQLGAVVACSKPVATDRKWFSEDRMIGLSGAICKPDLAITLGVSGQVQFTVGIRDARIIVSINIDENAPMNKMADYYLVADLKDVIPELEKMLI